MMLFVADENGNEINSFHVFVMIHYFYFDGEVLSRTSRGLRKKLDHYLVNYVLGSCGLINNRFFAKDSRKVSHILLLQPNYNRIIIIGRKI